MFRKQDDSPDIFKIRIEFSSTRFTLERKVYSFLEFLGDVGGLTDAIIIILSLLISKYASQSFLSAVLKEVCWANVPAFKQSLKNRLSK